MWWSRTVDDPRLDLRRFDLQRGRDGGVGHVPADVLETEGGECDEADFTLELRAVEFCGTTLESVAESTQ